MLTVQLTFHRWRTTGFFAEDVISYGVSSLAMYLRVTKVELREGKQQGEDCCIWMFVSLRTVSGVVF